MNPIGQQTEFPGGVYPCKYIWLDGSKPTQSLRSKTKIVNLSSGGNIRSRESFLYKFPDWGFDGSSTEQADGTDSDCKLHPVFFSENPLSGGFLVLCEVWNSKGRPHKSNTRAKLRKVLESGGKLLGAMVGFEQEYTMMHKGIPAGWPEEGEPKKQGPYYCGVGAGRVEGRILVDEHIKACIRIGLSLEGTNAEVMLAQWEFQIGAGDPLSMSDQLWVARWLLETLGERWNIQISYDPKPVEGDWNGAGMHTNFSTNATREDLEKDCDHCNGYEEIIKICKTLEKNTKKHLAVYGDGLKRRLTGEHETCSHKDFKYGVADRTASIRIPRHVYDKKKGYLEDRRPNANADPYLVSAVLLETAMETQKKKKKKEDLVAK